MVRNAQNLISWMFFIVGYFRHLGGGGLNEVWKISTQFFFEGFPNSFILAARVAVVVHWAARLAMQISKELCTVEF